MSQGIVGRTSIHLMKGWNEVTTWRLQVIGGELTISFHVEGFYKKANGKGNSLYMLTCRAESGDLKLFGDNVPSRRLKNKCYLKINIKIEKFYHEILFKKKFITCSEKFMVTQ